MPPIRCHNTVLICLHFGRCFTRLGREKSSVTSPLSTVKIRPDEPWFLYDPWSSHNQSFLWSSWERSIIKLVFSCTFSGLCVQTRDISGLRSRAVNHFFVIKNLLSFYVVRCFFNVFIKRLLVFWEINIGFTAKKYVKNYIYNFHFIVTSLHWFHFTPYILHLFHFTPYIHAYIYIYIIYIYIYISYIYI